MKLSTIFNAKKDITLENNQISQVVPFPNVIVKVVEKTPINSIEGSQVTLPTSKFKKIANLKMNQNKIPMIEGDTLTLGKTKITCSGKPSEIKMNTPDLWLTMVTLSIKMVKNLLKHTKPINTGNDSYASIQFDSDNGLVFAIDGHRLLLAKGYEIEQDFRVDNILSKFINKLGSDNDMITFIQHTNDLVEVTDSKDRFSLFFKSNNICKNTSVLHVVPSQVKTFLNTQETQELLGTLKDLKQGDLVFRNNKVMWVSSGEEITKGVEIDMPKYNLPTTFGFSISFMLEALQSIENPIIQGSSTTKWSAMRIIGTDNLTGVVMSLKLN